MSSRVGFRNFLSGARPHFAHLEAAGGVRPGDPYSSWVPIPSTASRLYVARAPIYWTRSTSASSGKCWTNLAQGCRQKVLWSCSDGAKPRRRIQTVFSLRGADHCI
jgi:hypothetical protein